MNAGPLTACLPEGDCPWVPRAIPPGGSRFSLGQRVLVHQHGGLDLSETHRYGFAGIKRIPHDCSDPRLHWASRVTGWSGFHRMVEIATLFRYPGGNPCSAEWVYGDDSLTPLDDGTPDWVATSRYAVGARVRFRWDCPHHLHYRHETALCAVVEAAHVDPGDWVCTFVAPGTGVYGAWRFMIVVNESEFIR